MKHRGAVAADSLSGDGAGLLLPIPRRLLADELGKDATDVAVAMLFLDPADPRAGREVTEQACAAEGLVVERWRSVPVTDSALGEQARATAPVIEQALITAADGDTGEHRAFRARRRLEQAARRPDVRVYVSSLSFRVVTYKALCAADQLGQFYGDLVDARFEAWFALFHQRYSTNTAPSWERAQPLRYLAHNGEINTIRGNVAAIAGRAGRLGTTELAPEELLDPVVDVDGSDSAVLDQVLELLVHGGRSLDHAAAMLLPQAWERRDDITPEVRDFFHYHSCLIEPWDGPAALVMSDGIRLAACLDRNGLRPLRLSLCEDGLVACASETGAVDTRSRGLVARRRLGPGELFVVDPSNDGILSDREIKTRLGRRRPYGTWLRENLTPASCGQPVVSVRAAVTPRQIAMGYTKEEITVVLRPMATEGQEPTSSMGDDTAQPPLAEHARPIPSFLKQRFAQITNPPIDHLRERDVMSLTTRLGSRGSLLREDPDAAAIREYPSFLLYPSALEELERSGAETVDATFDVGAGPDGLRAACVRAADEAEDAVRSGAPYLVITDRGATRDRVAVPATLAAGAVHHRLLRTRLRSLTALIVESDEPRETHHLACLITNGVDAICPRLALDSIVDLARRGRLGGHVTAEEAQRRYFQAVEEGLLKVMSKMGISTLDSYRGGQIIEAIGLGQEVIDLCFDGVNSMLGGFGWDEVGADVFLRHLAAYEDQEQLANTGFIKYKRGGEYHALNPEVVDALQDAAGLRERELAAAHALRRAAQGNAAAYGKFTTLADERPPTEPRDLLDFVPAGPPIPVEEVEPVSAIVARFSTGAMSHGALSAEAHETISIALNILGGKANTGEGGEDPVRYRDVRNSSIKQVASGRFGVTPEYLAFAEELQIKFAQGSKPGEGGQLPGKKVSSEIARLRHTVPGVALISPPPHHDIYSIEDLAQLVFDLKQANDKAKVSVKLVASEGVGTIAAGAVKGLADIVHIAGADGGTGASPLSSIKNAGMPWELGLAETQAALVASGLRGRARLRVDGGLKTGRDIVKAALLGADEFSFGTAALIAEGCILVRTCHRNTCPVGIATQDPELRAKFAGTPDMVARYLMLVADEVRSLLASLGLRSLDEAIGRTELLSQRTTGNARADSLSLAPLLERHGGDIRFTGSSPVQKPRSILGDRLFEDAYERLLDGELVQLSYTITNSDRAVGARLGCASARAFGSRRATGRVHARFEGAAGQSFGAFLSDGIDLTLTGEANDYLGKGMGGGRIAVRPPPHDAGDPCLVGNTVLYGATGGQLFVAGRAGERFAVRNSGAVAVVEGTGDHACEYMTAGAVVILGPTGRNLGAGMSGGEAYVYDPEDLLDSNLNAQLVASYVPTHAQLASLKRVLERHRANTGSPVATTLLAQWEAQSPLFKRVAPVAEVARLEALFEGTAVSAA